MLIGLLAGLTAGAFWGLTFVAPRAVQPYSEVDLAVLRYLAFGLISVVLMVLSPRFRAGRIKPRQAGLALFLGLTGYVIYYVFVAFSVRLSGPAIAPLVIGALPVLLAVYGNWREPAVRWRLLALPLGLITAGLALINIGTVAVTPDAGQRADVVLGFVLALGALVVWFSYGVMNAQALRAPDAPAALPWTALQGIGAMVGVLPLMILAPLMGWSEVPSRGLAGADGTRLVAWAVLTGMFGSWIAQYLWTLASQRLPLALAAQLIVSETIFALIYGFAYEARPPALHEVAGGVLLLGGVFIGVRLFARSGPRHG
jgi:drug/metabolite transporter (DMT)-like permease